MPNLPAEIRDYLRNEQQEPCSAEQIQRDLANTARLLEKPEPSQGAVDAALRKLAADKWAKETADGWVYLAEVRAVVMVQGGLFE